MAVLTDLGICGMSHIEAAGQVDQAAGREGKPFRINTYQVPAMPLILNTLQEI